MYDLVQMVLKSPVRIDNQLETASLIQKSNKYLHKEKKLKEKYFMELSI